MCDKVFLKVIKLKTYKVSNYSKSLCNALNCLALHHLTEFQMSYTPYAGFTDVLPNPFKKLPVCGALESTKGRTYLLITFEISFKSLSSSFRMIKNFDSNVNLGSFTLVSFRFFKD
jgi:hypothetical protein